MEAYREHNAPMLHRSNDHRPVSGGDRTKAPLTGRGSATWGNVYVIVDPKSSTPGGWAFYTAYPRP